MATIARNSLPEATLRELLLWLTRRRRRLRVNGASMLPTLAPGDTVLVDPRAYHGRVPAIGDLVAARHPRQPDIEIVKRVAVLEASGECYLLSDNPSEGTDSRSFGAIPQGLILGRVTSRIVA